MNKNINKLKQPPVFKLAFFTAMCERFGFYILSYMLVLYAKAEFNMSDSEAFGLFAVATALAFMTPAIGGYVADNIVGIRRSMILGLILESIGLCLLAIPSHFLFPISLSLVVIGVGLFKTAPTDLMGRAYDEKDQRIDSGFTLFYMGMNIGSFAASIISGVIEHSLGWHVAFLVGGIGIFTGLIFYAVFKNTAANLDAVAGLKKLSIQKWITIILIILGAILASSFLLSHEKINNVLFSLVGISLVLFYIFEIIRSSRKEKLEIIACLSLILIGLLFWALYFQAFTSIELFINRIVNRNVFGFVVPTEAYIGLNPFWVIVLGPILALAYKSIAKKYGKDLPVTLKFSIGLLSISLCFFCLVLSTFFANADYQIASSWILLVFGLYTLGEMLISALGVAMITHLVPKRILGITMGTWFFGSALAALSSGWFASFANVPAEITELKYILPIYAHAFTKIGIIGLSVTILAFIVGPFIKKIANLD